MVPDVLVFHVGTLFIYSGTSALHEKIQGEEFFFWNLPMTKLMNAQISPFFFFFFCNLAQNFHKLVGVESPALLLSVLLLTNHPQRWWHTSSMYFSCLVLAKKYRQQISGAVSHMHF